MSKMEPLS